MPNADQMQRTVAREVGTALNAVNADELGAAAEAILAAPRCFLAGAGRSGLVMQMLAMRLAQTGQTTHVAGDATTPACGTDDLLIIGSGSGTTPTMQIMAGRATEAGTRVLLFTRSIGSPLAAIATHVVTIPLPVDEKHPHLPASSQPLGALFEQSLLLATDTVAALVAARLGMDDEAMQLRHANLE